MQFISFLLTSTYLFIGENVAAKLYLSECSLSELPSDLNKVKTSEIRKVAGDQNFAPPQTASEIYQSGYLYPHVPRRDQRVFSFSP